jgi:predicted hydrolase (HD superfamily)
VTGRLADRIEKAVETHCSRDNARASERLGLAVEKPVDISSLSLRTPSDEMRKMVGEVRRPGAGEK